MTQDHAAHRDPGSRPQDDAISLVEMACTVWRRRWWVLGTFALVVSAAAAWTVIQPDPGYEGEATLSWVPIPEGLLDEPVPDMGEALSEPVRALGEGRDATVSVSVGEDQLTVKVRGPERAVVEALLDDAVHDASKRLESAWLPYARDAADAWSTHMEGLEARRAELRDLVDEGGSPERLAALTSAEMAVWDRIDAENERAQDRGGQLRPLLAAQRAGRLTEAGMLSEPQVYSRSRTPIILALSVALGAFLGLFVAFFLDLLNAVRGDSGDASSAPRNKPSPSP